MVNCGLEVRRVAWGCLWPLNETVAGIDGANQAAQNFPSASIEARTVSASCDLSAKASTSTCSIAVRSTTAIRSAASVEPKDNGPLQSGVIYLAPPNHHLLFEPQVVVIQRGPKEHSTRPAIDPLFRSAAASYGERVVGVLLMGCGEDGVIGPIAISHRSGLTLAQDPEEAYMPYMPLNALRFDQVAGVFALRDMATLVSALAEGQPVAARRPPLNAHSEIVG